MVCFDYSIEEIDNRMAVRDVGNACSRLSLSLSCAVILLKIDSLSSIANEFFIA